MISLFKREMYYSCIINIKYFLYLILILIIYNQFQENIVFYGRLRPDFLTSFANNIGINYEVNHFLGIIIIILTNVYFLYNAISSYLKDIKYGPEQLFLRISKVKFVSVKIICIFFSTLVFNIFIYALLSIIFLVHGYKFDFNVVYLLLIDTFIKTLIQCLGLILFNFFGSISSLIPTIFASLVVVKRLDYLSVIFPFSNLNGFNPLLSLLLLCLMLILTIFICYKRIYSLYEREKIYGI